MADKKGQHMEAKEFEWFKPECLLRVFIKSDKPNLKGARAKAQKILKNELDIYDAMCFYQWTEESEDGCWLVYKVSSPTLVITEFLRSYHGR